MAGPGVLSTILDTTGERVKERIAASNKLDDGQRQAQGDALLRSIYAVDEKGQPVLSEADAEDAWARYEALHKHNKSVKDIVAKAKDITKKIFNHGTPSMLEGAKNKTQQAVSQPQPSEAPADVEGLDKNMEAVYTGLTPPPARSGSGQQQTNLPAPPPRSTVSLMRAGAPPNPVHTEALKLKQQSEDAIALENVKSANRIKEIEATAKAHGDKKISQYTGDDGKLHLIFQAADGSTYEQGSDGQVRPYVSRLSPGSHVSVTDARELFDKLGQQFLDEAGKPIDLSQLNVGMELIPITGGLPNRYKASTQNRVTETFDNRVVTAPALERGNVAAQTTLGAARVPTDSTSETTLINPEGQAEAVTLRQTSTPVTPASPAQTPPSTPRDSSVDITPLMSVDVVDAPVRSLISGIAQNYGLNAVLPAGLSGSGSYSIRDSSLSDALTSILSPLGMKYSIEGKLLKVEPISAGQGGLTQPPTRSSAPTGGSRPLGNLLPAAERDKQLQVARPVRAAAVQLFGDPTNPNVESLVSFSDLANDPKSRERVGTAARMIINDLTAADKAGGIGGQILGEGASLHGGDIWQALKNKTGISQWIGASQVQATENALKALTPRESRMLNQIMAAYGTVVGLRTLTKGGAYQFSVASMERELPIPGIADVKDSASYNNKLAKIANEVVEGSKGISDGVLPEKKFYKEQADRLNQMGQSRNSTGLPTPPPRDSGDGYGPVEDVVVNGKTVKARKNLATGKYKIQ